jgi:hypothetical protein
VDISSFFETTVLKSGNRETFSTRATCLGTVYGSEHNRMSSPFTNDGDDEIDRSTTAAICNAIGERLRRDMGPEEDMPSRLQSLLTQLQQLDNDGG